MTRRSPEDAFSADALPRRSPEELRELSRCSDADRGDWRNAARGYKDQRDVLQAELDAARARIAALEAELTKVKGHRAVLSERCYHKDLELDELRANAAPSTRKDRPMTETPVSPQGEEATLPPGYEWLHDPAQVAQRAAFAMTPTPAPDAAVQIAKDTVQGCWEGTPYDGR